MPVSEAQRTGARIRLAGVAGRHLVHRDAEDEDLSEALTAQRQAACENFAIRGLQEGANISNVPGVLGAIYMNEDNIIPDGLGAGFQARAVALRDGIRGVFGNFFNPRVTIAAAEGVWNARKEQLHDWTATAFELVLDINGFTRSDDATDYMVCMEYECPGTNPEQPMYPNHTHAWLMLQQQFIIQTVTGANISISHHHAGHQPHCGFIRRYVTDFHANQLEVIANITEGPLRTTAGVTGCGDDFVADGYPWATDEHSPEGKIASV